MTTPPPPNQGTVTPAPRAKLEREVAELLATCSDAAELQTVEVAYRALVEKRNALLDTCVKPRKLRDMLDLLAGMG